MSSSMRITTLSGMFHSSKALLIFIKNPELGKVKTRLAETLGDPKALKIYLSLLAYTRQVALKVSAERYLFYSRYVENQDEWSPLDFHKLTQEGEDLGVRMLNAFQLSLSRHQKAVIIGSDCATLTSDIIEDAFLKLDEVDCVIGPATDGGYYLLGMREVQPELFQQIPWSTENVRSLTIRRIKKSGRTYALLPELSDIDREEDWKKYGWEIPR